MNACMHPELSYRVTCFNLGLKTEMSQGDAPSLWSAKGQNSALGTQPQPSVCLEAVASRSSSLGLRCNLLEEPG